MVIAWVCREPAQKKRRHIVVPLRVGDELADLLREFYRLGGWGFWARHSGNRTSVWSRS